LIASGIPRDAATGRDDEVSRSRAASWLDVILSEAKNLGCLTMRASMAEVLRFAQNDMGKRFT
jgi:hypothetical protein